MKTLAASLLCSVALLSVTGCAKKAAPSNETAPSAFTVELDTTKGPVVISVARADAPLGVDRFYNLVKAKYFDGARFFRVVPNFIIQFGLAADPKVTAAWDFPINDDAVIRSNVRGTVSYAAHGPDSRTAQLFINTGDNQKLDTRPDHFAVIGQVTSGMENVDHIYSGYGEKPQQQLIEAEGNAYLEREFPSLDYIRSAKISR